MRLQYPEERSDSFRQICLSRLRGSSAKTRSCFPTEADFNVVWSKQDTREELKTFFDGREVLPINVTSSRESQLQSVWNEVLKKRSRANPAHLHPESSSLSVEDFAEVESLNSQYESMIQQFQYPLSAAFIVRERNSFLDELLEVCPPEALYGKSLEAQILSVVKSFYHPTLDPVWFTSAMKRVGETQILKTKEIVYSEETVRVELEGGGGGSLLVATSSDQLQRALTAKSPLMMSPLEMEDIHGEGQFHRISWQTEVLVSFGLQYLSGRGTGVEPQNFL